MEQDVYGSCFDINDRGSAIFPREDGIEKFGWDEKGTTEKGILESHDHGSPQWNDFTESTTFHGIKYIFDFKASKLRRALWVCCVLVSVGLFLVQVFTRAQAYFSYKSNVLVAVVYEKDLPFPAVTICNQNNFRLTKTLETGKLVYEFIDKIYSESEIQDVKEFDITNYAETLSKIDLKEFITTTAHQKYDLIDSCRWKGQVCNLSDFRTVHTDLGVCYSFNFDSNETKYTNVAGNRGLSIVMNVEQYEYMRGPQNDAGLKILLHHQNDTPMVKDLGFSVAPGTHAEIGINHIEKLTLESPYGDCHPNAEPLAKCMTHCKAKTAVKMCGCKDLFMEFSEAPICNVEKAFRCIPYALEIGEGDLGSCQCSSPCEQSLYEHSFSFATLSKFNIERVVLNDPNAHTRVWNKFINAKEVAVRNIPKYKENDKKQIEDLLNVTTWITNNITMLSNQWADRDQFSLIFNTFDIVTMGEDMIREDKEHDFFEKRKNLINCLMQGMIPETNGDCIRHSNTSMVIKNVLNFISNLEYRLFRYNYQPLVHVLEDCFNKSGNLELNASSTVCSNITTSTSSMYYMYYSTEPMFISSWSSGPTPSPFTNMTMNTTHTTMSPEQKTSECRKMVQCTADSALALYKEKPNYLDEIVDTVRSDFDFVKNLILVDTTRSEDDIREKYIKYGLCLHNVDSLQNVTSILVTLTEMLEEFHSLRYGQLGDLLNHTRNMASLFNYQQIYFSFQDIDRDCIPWVDHSFCTNPYYYVYDNSNPCVLTTPSDIITRFRPIIENILESITKLDYHWTKHVPIYGSLATFLDGNLNKANLTGIFLSPRLTNDLSIISDLVKDTIEVMKSLKETLQNTETELLESYKIFFSNKFDWFTHSSFEEFALIKYLRKIEAEGNINGNVKYALDQLHRDGEVNHQIGFENLLKLVFQIRKDDLQYYIDFFEKTMESLLNANMEKVKENLSEYANEMKMDEKFFMANFLQVDIFYKELKYQKIEQQVAFSLISLFSEVGGFLGLLLGASVLTVCELLDYIALIIISRMQKIKSTKVTALENETQPPVDSLA